MIAAVAPAALALLTFETKSILAREISAMLPATAAGNSPGWPRPQYTRLPLTPAVFGANSRPKERCSTPPAVTLDSEPVLAGTADRTITPGAVMSIAEPRLEKLATTSFESTAPTATLTG